MLRRILSAIFVALMLLTIQGFASAEPLAGKDMKVQVIFNGSEFDSGNFTRIFTVDPNYPQDTVELPAYGNGAFSINVFDTGPNTASVLITNNFVRTYGDSNDGRNLLSFSGVSAQFPTFTNVVLGASSSAYNDPSRVSFSGETFIYNFNAPLSVQQGDFLRLDLTVRPVPAPSALAAFVIGAVPGAAVLLRRRRKA